MMKMKQMQKRKMRVDAVRAGGCGGLRKWGEREPGAEEEAKRMSNGRSKGSECITDGFRITVQPEYMTEHSSPAEGKYLFSYTITIRNESSRRARLCSRHWIIVDADGERTDVRGEGVIGETPMLAPGTAYRYSSFCPLPTEWGTMEGTYVMEADDGEVFEVAVARFFLVSSPIHTLMKA